MVRTKYEIKRDLVVKNLDKDKLVGYIDNLIKNIYECYLSNDLERAKDNIEHLHEIISYSDLKYPNINNYINYRCIIISNKIFESLFKRNSQLYYPSLKLEIDEKTDDYLAEVLSDKDMMLILDYGLDFEEDFNRFLDFLMNLPELKYYFKDELTINNRIPRQCIAKITDFLNDVKKGVYDGYLEIPEDYIIDDDDYLDRYEYCEKRHKEKKNDASENVFKH